jgi:membrane-bound serine protease (ClpP class)
VSSYHKYDAPSLPKGAAHLLAPFGVPFSRELPYKRDVLNSSRVRYLKEVLGLDQVLWPVSAAPKPTCPEWAFVGHCQTAEENDLLLKILGAMKLDPQNVKLYQLPMDRDNTERELLHLDPLKVVWMGEPAAIKGASEIPSLSEMLSSQEHKRSAWKTLQGLLATFVLVFSCLAGASQEKKSEPPQCAVQMDLTSAVGPATLDLLERSFAKAKNESCGAVFIRINTPGGNLQTTRLMVEKIVNSPIPVLCLVSPSGGHAGSAGAILLQACHVNGALTATSIGAATPVTLGEEMSKDLRNKVVNDTVSLLDGLTTLRARNKQFGRDIIEKATSVDAAEAFRLKAIDFTGSEQQEFLNFSNQRVVKINGGKTATISVGSVIPFVQDLRFRFLDLVAHPQIAYLIFMGSIALLYFEITHTGMIAPGVIGAFGLITSLMSFHMLEVRWGGLALLVLGLALMVAEIFVTSFGALGIGGIVAFVAGSLLLYEPATAILPLMMVLPTALGLGAAMLLVGSLALRAQRTEVSNPGMVGQKGQVTDLSGDLGLEGHLEYHGEIWSFQSVHPVKVGDTVYIHDLDGLVLKVSNKEFKGV